MNHNIREKITDDFYGCLTGKSLQIKKVKTLEIYRYFFRFCSEKLDEFIKNPYFVAMLV